MIESIKNFIPLIIVLFIIMWIIYSIKWYKKNSLLVRFLVDSKLGGANDN